jgi:hypothetical protein
MKLNPLVLALGLFPLVGCGGGDESPPVTQSIYSVKAIDGYLRNAQVWLDLNGNYQLDGKEPSALSGEGGAAMIDVTGIENPQQYSVVVKAVAGQTIDEDSITEANPTGAVTTTPYLLSAPAGQTVISPLSTFVKIKMETESQTQEEAVKAVATDLGIAETELLSDYVAAGKTEIAAKANALVELKVLPKSEAQMQEMSAKGDDTLDAQLAPNLATVKALTEDTRLVQTADDTFIPVTIIAKDDVDYDEDADGSDKDGDGIINLKDAFPDDPQEWSDFDKDTIGDNSDPDDDGDDTVDTEDVFPFDALESIDSDNDGTGNNADLDDDNDSILDTEDAFPLDATETIDSDKDGTGNNADLDDDNDSVLDTEDAFPLDATETIDSDKDGTGNNADLDDDNDGVLDTDDAFQIDATETIDSDKDGTGNNADLDDDNDSVLDTEDAFPLDATETIDSDKDGTGNNADTDDDDDGVLDSDDAFPFDATEATDSDGDGTGDNADLDDDNDGVLDSDEVTSALVGTWSTTDIVFTFNNDMSYSMEQKTSDDQASDSTTGTETGIYAYDKDTGAITVSEITDDNNGTSGLSDMLNENSTLSFSLSAADPAGNNLTFSYQEDDEQGTFVLYKTLETSAESFVTANPDFAFIDTDEGKLEYDEVSWGGAPDYSLSTTIYKFNDRIQSFDEVTDTKSDYILTSEGWGYAVYGNETLTPQTDGSMVYSNNYESSALTGKEWILSGANIYQFQENVAVEDSLLAMFNDSVTFSEGAALYEMTSASTSEPVYSLRLDSCAQPQGFTDLPMITVADTGLCNTQYSTTDGAAVTSIAQITVTSSFANTGSTSWRDFGGMYFNNYAIRLVNDGSNSVDIYNLDWENNTITPVSGDVTWQTITVNEKTLVTFSTDNLVLSELNGLILTEIGGYVRIGETWGDSPEDNEVELMFNGIAKDDILAAFIPSNISDNVIPLTALIGSWKNDDVVFQFNSDMTYNMQQITDDQVGDDSYAGTEFGTYSYDPDTGAITIALISADNNGTSGLSDYVNNPDNSFVLTAYQADSSVTFSYVDGDESGEFTLTASTDAPDAFSTEYVAGKTFYVVWFGDGDDVNGDLYNVPVVIEMNFNANGELTGTGLLNTSIPADLILHYQVSDNGLLYIEEDQDTASEGNRITCGSTSDYIKTQFVVNEQFDNVDLYFFDKQTALDYASGLTESIPVCTL